MKKPKPKNYLQVLTKLEKAISEGDIDGFKKLSNLLIDCTSNVENHTALTNDCDNASNPIRNTNVIILACKHNKLKILEYLFGSNFRILNNLSVALGRTATLPDDEDETCHNAFYYAIRSDNIELLDLLIKKWPVNYFTVNLEALDQILSKTYKELKLKNVPLSDEMENFVENELINLRFFSNASQNGKPVGGNLNNIRERIELILQNIGFLQTNYSNTESVDKKFLFVAQSIAQNIYTLKRQLKSTYIRLPWEEIEFCLVSFVSSYTKGQEINLFYRAALNKRKILKHLENFAKKLQDEKDIIKGMNIGKLADIPCLKRETVVAEIIRSYPPFEELYTDYRQIRDIHSLDKLSTYIQLALSADPKEREGQLIITRVLQAIGEYLKNTLESPKLSDVTSELLLLSLQRNARKIIVDLRNSLSHSYSLSKRMQIEENSDVKFFINIQNDIKKVGEVVTDIRYNNKMNTVRILLKKIVDSEISDEIKELAEVLDIAALDEMLSGSVKISKHEKLKKLVKELNNKVTEKTCYEKELFNKINSIMDSIGTQSEAIKTDYVYGFASLMGVSVALAENNPNYNTIRIMKYHANETLKNITPEEKLDDLKEIGKLSGKIQRSVELRMPDDKLYKVINLSYEIFYITEFGTGDIKFIEELREKMNDTDTFNIPKPKKTKELNEDNKNKLELKLSELKSILSNNSLSGPLTEKLSSYKNDKKLQAVIEMLVLDIMSILSRSKLEDNPLFLGDNTPLLIGKCLRNHLAHGNALVDILLSDPSIAVILNAKQLTEGNLLKSKKKIGKLVSDDLFKLQEKYNRDLVTITNQESMFVALEEGNLESLKDCLKKGADIKARNINLWTTLHFAAKGPSLEVVKFVLDQNLSLKAKNKNGESPLYIAAAHGRENIVEFFLRDSSLHVDDVNKRKKTPLHIAAKNGHKKTVEVLLKNKADAVTQDGCGVAPLHYAIRNNHIEVVKILLEKDANVNINETKGGFTPLHEAAEYGYLEIVNFLLQNKANVNAKTDKNAIPLHTTALNGHLEVVNALILKGSDVNAAVVDGCTPLHYAVETGREKIANILLRHGANANAVDKTYRNTPLHYAAKDGHKGIVKILLNNKANARVATVEGFTPLHFAAQNNRLEIVAILLTHGVDIHAKTVHNDTPLHFAAACGHKEIAEILIQHKADINTKGSNNWTPLHLATQKRHNDVIDILIKNKARVDAKDIHGNTPLHQAAMNCSNEIIDLLIKNKTEVNIRNNVGFTPLHTAALSGHGTAVDFLIKNKAEINARCDYGITPLHLAVKEGHIDVVKLLIKNKAEIDERAVAGITLLNLAVEAGHKEIVDILVTNGANVNVESDKQTPLQSAIKCNNKEIVEVLLRNGANVDGGNSEALSLAVFGGYTDIVEILLKHNASVNTCIIKDMQNVTPLHMAAMRGHKKIVNVLIKCKADVNAITTDNIAPICCAAQGGFEEVVEILIAAGADVNFKSNEDFTSLHSAASGGHSNVVKVLLDNNADINVKDRKKRNPIELAVAHGRLEIVKLLLQHKKVDINAKGNDDWTLLHIASQGTSSDELPSLCSAEEESNLDIVKYLVDEGSDINSRNASGSKPIHIAAREGFKDTIEFFLGKGLSIEDRGAANQTLLHYAAMKGRLEIVNYLIAKGSDVNAKDINGSTPIHIAANFGYKEVIQVLLKNDAVYNAMDNLYRKPLQVAKDKNVITLLTSTEKLFEAVKCNGSSDVQNFIKAGAFVNAKNVDGETPLHYAAWKGYNEVVDILLKNKANPNVVRNKGLTPLHYAAKFSYLKIVKALLSNNAIYNALSDGGKTPSDFTVDDEIAGLFKLLSESFKRIKNNNVQVVKDLNKIKDIETVRAIMSARNRKNNTLVVAAMHSNFSKVEQLKQILQGDVKAQTDVALMLGTKGKYQEALNILKNLFEKRKEILGSDNPGTLDIQTDIAKIIYKRGAYQEALNIFEEILQKQTEILGLNDKDTLNTRGSIALVLYRQAKTEEAFNIYQEVYQKQKEILGPNHLDVLDTQFHMALVLHHQRKYEEALSINREVYKKRKEMFGSNSITTVLAQNNIAMVLASQDNHEEALKIYREVYEKKKSILGLKHTDTLRTLQHIASVLLTQKKYHESLQAYQKVLNIQESALGPNHPETLNTQYLLGCVLFTQGKWISSLKAYKKCFYQLKVLFGPSHPSVSVISTHIKVISEVLKFQGSELSEVLDHLQKEINFAASNGDVQTVQHLLKNGADVNDRDIDGRTPLHFAVSKGHMDIVNILLNNGADVTQVTNKGNTPLHTATSEGYNEIVDVLLKHVSCDKLNDYINAKTITSGATSLHVAAKKGFLDVTKCLLRRGAIYSIKNNEGKTPLDLSKEPNVTNLLKQVEDLFEDAKSGNVENIGKLKAKSDELVTVTNARNNQGKTLLQVSIANKRKNVTGKLLEVLK